MASNEEVKSPKWIRSEDAAPIFALGDDLLQNILFKLSAVSYFCAASTCKTFNRICKDILCRPKLVSSLSLNAILQNAVNEVVEKVLSKPIQPHFAIASVRQKHNLQKAHQYIVARLGENIPVITCVSQGIIGRESVTGDFKEVEWDADDSGGHHLCSSKDHVCHGVLLTIGYLPGVKISMIPLPKPTKCSERNAMIDSFLSNTRSYTTSVSDRANPLGIIMFMKCSSDMNYAVERMGCELDGETVVVGGACGSFIFSSVYLAGPSVPVVSGHAVSHPLSSCQKYDGVALVFAAGAGISFRLFCSSGLSPVGPTYRIASVRDPPRNCEKRSCFIFTREGSSERICGGRIIREIFSEIDGTAPVGDLYIGVLKQRKDCHTSWGGRNHSLTFHAVLGSGRNDYLNAEGFGIRAGDIFRFYAPNIDAASTCLSNISEVFKHIKASALGSDSEPCERFEVFGGLMFACCGKGESFYRRPNVDSSAFLDCFPEVSLGGIFCGGEIGFDTTDAWEDECFDPKHAYLHVYSTMYLLMAYNPEPQS